MDVRRDVRTKGDAICPPPPIINGGGIINKDLRWDVQMKTNAMWRLVCLHEACRLKRLLRKSFLLVWAEQSHDLFQNMW